MPPNLRSVSAQVPRAYGQQARSFSSSFPSSTRGSESKGLGGYIARAVAVAVGYGIVGPRLFGDTDLEFEEERRKRVELLEETETMVSAYEAFRRKS